MSKAEEERRRHEYLLSEIRLTAEDTKEYFQDKFDKIEIRVSSLENFKSYLKGMAKGVAWVGGTSSFSGILYKIFHHGEKILK